MKSGVVSMYRGSFNMKISGPIKITISDLISFFGYEILNGGKLTRGNAPDLNIAAVRDKL